jgi:hypothetical protein
LTSLKGSVFVSQDGIVKRTGVSKLLENELEANDLGVYESDIVRRIFDGVDGMLGHLDDLVEELEQGNSKGSCLHGDKR